MSNIIEKLIAELDSPLSPNERVDKLNSIAWAMRDVDLERALNGDLS